MEFSRKRKGLFLKNSVGFVLAVVFSCCLLIMIMTTLRLPAISLRKGTLQSHRALKIKKIPNNEKLGKFGEMMIDMLPEDLAFTIFIPSETAFKRDLGLMVNNSFTSEKMNDTYAVVSRVLGFSTVPRGLPSGDVPVGKEVVYDSLSGFGLSILKDFDGMLVVNGVKSVRVDVKKMEIVVHVMDGVIMDADFQQSVQPDDDEED